MEGIYNDTFLDYLKDNLGDPVKTNARNIICNCPWCDVGVTTSKPHLWISTEAPMFHCFRGGCQQSGVVKKLLEKIEGKDSSDQYVDMSKVTYFAKKKLEFGRNEVKLREFNLPPLNESMFAAKALYVRRRLKFSNVPLESIRGLVFDVKRFIENNNIKLEDKVLNFLDYLHSNFVGIVADNQSCVIFRNIDSRANFRYYKLKVQPTNLLDYYSLVGGNINTNNIVLAEGIFDIYAEHIYDSIGLKNQAKLYAAALSTSYPALIKSVVFDYQIFRPDVHILSDSEIPQGYYKRIKKRYSHLINSLTVYYNKKGKDFNDTPVVVIKHVI